MRVLNNYFRLKKFEYLKNNFYSLVFNVKTEMRSYRNLKILAMNTYFIIALYTFK